MGIDVPYTKDEINSASKKIINIQKVKNGYVRPVIWRGSDGNLSSAKQNTCCYGNLGVGIILDPKLKEEGKVRYILLEDRPKHYTGIPKQLVYMICTLSKHEAEKNGYTDSCARSRGNIAESTGANVF